MSPLMTIRTPPLEATQEATTKNTISVQMRETITQRPSGKFFSLLNTETNVGMEAVGKNKRTCGVILFLFFHMKIVSTAGRAGWGKKEFREREMEGGVGWKRWPSWEKIYAGFQ